MESNSWWGINPEWDFESLKQASSDGSDYLTIHPVISSKKGKLLTIRRSYAPIRLILGIDPHSNTQHRLDTHRLENGKTWTESISSIFEWIVDCELVETMSIGEIVWYADQQISQGHIVVIFSDMFAYMDSDDTHHDGLELPSLVHDHAFIVYAQPPKVGKNYHWRYVR